MSRTFEYRSDFEQPEFELRQVSIVKRPDAISQDKLTAFSAGPIAIGDTSKNLTYRSWRLRAIESEDEYYNVVYKVVIDNMSGYTEELLVLGLICDPPYNRIPREIDLGFTNDGFPVVAIQFDNNEIWLYKYKQSSFDFITNGISPRTTLDIPFVEARNFADQQLFYIRNGIVRQRTAADNYEEERSPNNISASFIEETYFSGFRFHVVYSIHNASSGRYTYGVLSSTLLPVYLDTEGLAYHSRIFSASNIIPTEVCLIVGCGITLNGSGILGDQVCGYGITEGCGARIRPLLHANPWYQVGPGLEIISP